MEREIKIFFEEQIYGYVFLQAKQSQRIIPMISKFIVIDYHFGEKEQKTDVCARYIILVAISQLLENQKKKLVNEKYDNFVQLFFVLLEFFL